MKIKEWAQLHGFDDDDAKRIDEVKKMFGGTIDIVRTKKEYEEEMKRIAKQNKINIDRIFIK